MKPNLGGGAIRLSGRGMAEGFQFVQCATSRDTRSPRLPDPVCRRFWGRLASRRSGIDALDRQHAPGRSAAVAMSRSCSAPSAGTAGVDQALATVLGVSPALETLLLAIRTPGVPEQLLSKLGLHDPTWITVHGGRCCRLGGRPGYLGGRKPPLIAADGDIYYLDARTTPVKPGNPVLLSYTRIITGNRFTRNIRL